MAKLRAGILGNIRGKVAGVVGSQWKNVNYVREFIKPANPNTAAQQVQRGLMSKCVLFCKTLVGPVFNAYTDKFYKGMSGFNHFIKTNITYFTASPSWSSIKVTEGKLSPVSVTGAVYTSGTGACVISFDKNLGNNGSDTDQVFAIVYDHPTGQWYFAAAEVDRSTETITVTCDTGLTPGNLSTWTWPIKYVATLVDMIGDSDYQLGEAP